MKILDWLLCCETPVLAFEDFLCALMARLRAEGLDLWRVSTSLRTFHPEVFVRVSGWTDLKDLGVHDLQALAQSVRIFGRGV